VTVSDTIRVAGVGHLLDHRSGSSGAYRYSTIEPMISRFPAAARILQDQV
jgi:hypothetical protein